MREARPSNSTSLDSPSFNFSLLKLVKFVQCVHGKSISNRIHASFGNVQQLSKLPHPYAAPVISSNLTQSDFHVFRGSASLQQRCRSKSGIAQGRLMLGYCLETVMIMGLFCVCYLVGPSLPAAHPHTQTHADARTVAGERGRRAVRRRGGGENATPCIAAAMSRHLVRWTLRI